MKFTSPGLFWASNRLQKTGERHLEGYLILTDHAKGANSFHLGVFQKENDQIIFIPPRGINTLF